MPDRAAIYVFAEDKQLLPLPTSTASALGPTTRISGYLQPLATATGEKAGLL